MEGCDKCAQGKTLKCVRHGGGVRCGIEGCGKTAKGKLGLCISHGGGVRCSVALCGKAAADAKTLKCLEHGDMMDKTSYNCPLISCVSFSILFVVFLTIVLLGKPSIKCISFA